MIGSVEPGSAHPESRPDQGWRSSRDIWLFLTLLSVLCTVVGYRFGYGNQTEQIPIILRHMDSSFLSNDFFVEAASGFGPRFYYAKFIALLATGFSLPWIFFVLTLVVNAGVVGVSYAATREVFRTGRLAGCLAAIFSVCVSGFGFGMAADIRFEDFQPASMAIPWALAALWMGMTDRPLLASLFAVIASIWHPLYGIETGALALLVVTTRILLDADGTRFLIRPICGAVILLVNACCFWILPGRGFSGDSLTATGVIEILGRFRSPHHYLASTFPARQYLALVLFILFGIRAFTLFIAKSKRRRDIALLAAPAAILAACFCAYLFVEIWPFAAWVTAQPFRLLFALKWQGYLVMAWLLALWFESPAPPRFLIAAAMLFGTLTLIAAGARQELILVVLSGLLLSLLRTASNFRRIGALLITVGIVTAAFTNRVNQFTALKELMPVLVEADHRGDEADISRWAGGHTPAESVFITPASLEEFRFIARRAMVVDFKSIPFGADAMREWHRRLITCYGPVTGGGFPALALMDRNYLHIAPGRLKELGESYGASYAVLFSKTPTEQTALYQNATYKIIRL
jgi:hypothetical protein